MICPRVCIIYHRFQVSFQSYSLNLHSCSFQVQCPKKCPNKAGNGSKLSQIMQQLNLEVNFLVLNGSFWIYRTNLLEFAYLLQCRIERLASIHVKRPRKCPNMSQNCLKSFKMHELVVSLSSLTQVGHLILALQSEFVKLTI